MLRLLVSLAEKLRSVCSLFSTSLPELLAFSKCLKKLLQLIFKLINKTVMHLFCMPWCFGICTHCGIANWSTKQLLHSFSFEYPGFKRMAQLFFFLILLLIWDRVSLCGYGWPGTHRFNGLCLLGAGTKGTCHHAWCLFHSNCPF